MNEENPYAGRIREERKRMGITQEAFGLMLGVGRTAVVNFESGKATPDLKALGKALENDVDAIYLLTGKRRQIAASDFLDWSLIQQIHLGIRKWCSDHDAVLSPDKEFGLLKLFYEQYSKNSAYDSQVMASTLRLVA